MNRHVRFGSALFLSLALGCSHVVRPPLEKEIGHREDLERPWVRVEGFTGRDGVRHEVRGYAWITPDSFLVYASEPRRIESSWSWAPDSRPIAGLARSDVDRIHVKKIDPVATTILTAFVIAVVAGTIAVVEIESTNFCCSSH